jgi:hypothetical protein
MAALLIEDFDLHPRHTNVEDYLTAASENQRVVGRSATQFPCTAVRLKSPFAHKKFLCSRLRKILSQTAPYIGSCGLPQ